MAERQVYKRTATDLIEQALFMSVRDKVGDDPRAVGAEVMSLLDRVYIASLEEPRHVSEVLNLAKTE